jgi:hypothetical protein
LISPSDLDFVFTLVVQVEPEMVCFGRLMFECAMGFAMPAHAPLEAAAQAADMPVPVYEV